jgi:uncharacterized protein YbgA (DUF1722 family)
MTTQQFCNRVRNLFTNNYTRENRPSLEEKQCRREIKHSISSDAAAGATAYSMLLILEQYIKRHGNQQVQAEFVGRMAQYERGEVSTMEVIAQCTSMIAVYANETLR